jgi:hypothetical protein
MAAAAVFALAALSVGPAEAKQCVWNKGGFVLRVDWMQPGTVSVGTGADGYSEFSFTDQPVQTDVIWSAQGRCIDRGPVQYEAVLSICGSIANSRVIAYPSHWPVDRRIDCAIWKSETPSTTRYLDIWGGLYNPASGAGGPI